MPIFIKAPPGQTTIWIPRDKQGVPTPGSLGTKPAGRGYVVMEKVRGRMQEVAKRVNVVIECIEDVHRNGAIEITENQKKALLSLDPDRTDIFESDYAQPGRPTIPEPKPENDKK